MYSRRTCEREISLLSQCRFASFPCENLQFGMCCIRAGVCRCSAVRAVSTDPRGRHVQLTQKRKLQPHTCSMPPANCGNGAYSRPRSEEHTSELQSLMRISYAVFCLNKKKNKETTLITTINNKYSMSPDSDYTNDHHSL